MTNFMRDLILSTGKIIIFFGSLITLLLAIGYMFFPELLKMMSRSMDKMFEIEEWLYLHRQAAGAAFLAITVILFLVLALIR